MATAIIGSATELLDVIGQMRQVGTDTQRYEVKSCSGGLTKDIARSISAFSNGTGGTLILGVDEREGFVPARGFDARKVQDALANICRQQLEPIVNPIIDVLALDGHPVVVAAIPALPPRDKPCYVRASGRYTGSYLRVGDGDRRLSAYEVDRLMEEHRQPRHDERVVEDATRDDLDPRLVARLLERERTVHPRSFADISDVDALRRLRVLLADHAGELRPTMAALLALGSYPQEFFPRLNVTFSCYPGLSKDEATADGRRFLDSMTFVGPIPLMVSDAMAAVERNTRTGGRIEGAWRTDVPDYPVMAIRESIANALMHRDLSDEGCGSSVLLDLYPDRLEVINPGGLYGAVTIDTLENTAGGSCRNQRLATLLESTPMDRGGYVAENRGTGYRAIRTSMLSYGHPAPEPQDTIDFFRLTLRRVGCDSGNGSSRDRQNPSIMAIVRVAGDVSVTELANALHRPRSTVAKQVAGLVRDGLLEPTQPTRSPRQRYRLPR